MALSLADQLKAFCDLTQKQIQSAAARSLNRAMTSTRAEASKRVRDVYKIKSAEAKSAITIGKVSAKESLSKMSGTIEIKGNLIPLYAFSPSVRKIKTAHGIRMGVSVNVMGQRKIVRGAFVATVGNGHIGIFKRKGDRRLPIKELFGPTVIGVFKTDDRLVTGLLDYARAQVASNFEKELQYQLSKGAS